MTTAMADWLRNAHDRAQSRLAHCRRELERFLDSYDPFDLGDERTKRKLEEDLRRAEIDLGYAQNAVARAMAPEAAPPSLRN